MKEIIARTRRRFNDYVKTKGNEIRPSLFGIPNRIMHDGLGDVLTAEITPKRVGAFAGAVSPYALMCAWPAYHGDSGMIMRLINSAILYTASFPLSVSASVICARYGMEKGREISEELRYRKINNNLRREIKERYKRLDEQKYKPR